MKIVFLIRSLHAGGAERQLTVLARSLLDRGHEVNVVTFYAGGPFERELINAGVQIHSLGKRGRWDVFPFLRKLLATIRILDPALVYSFMPGENLAGIFVKLLLRKPLVWGLRSSFMDMSKYDTFSRIVYRLESLLSNMADLVIANSTAGREIARSRGFDASRIRVITNGIDCEYFRPDPDAGRVVRTELKLEASAILVGNLGRLDPIKDHATFFRAAAIVARRDPSTRFLCIGDEPSSYQASLIDLTEELGIRKNVIWVCRPESLPALYSALDVLVSSSYGEGFSNVIAEAMACGVRCVVTDVGDSGAIVGDHGIVVRAGDVSAMARAISEAIGSRSPETSALARTRICDNFSVRTMADQTERALREIPL